VVVPRCNFCHRGKPLGKILKVRVAKDTAIAGQCIGNPIHQRHRDGASKGIPPGTIQTTIGNPKILFLPEAGKELYVIEMSHEICRE